MQQRMRGAGHGQIEDVSFQLDFSDEPTSEIEPQSSPEQPPPRTTPTPNTSAKRRKLDTNAARILLPQPVGANQAARQSPGKPDVYELPEGSSTESAKPAPAETETSPTAPPEEDGPNSVESLPPPRPAAPPPPVSPIVGRVAADHDEVEESPADAPGSGRRRRRTAPNSSALAFSAKLQQALSPEENETVTVPISSPLERKARRTTTSTRRSTLSSRRSRSSDIPANDDTNALSPDDAEKSAGRTLSPELSYHGGSQLEESTAQSDKLQPEPDSVVEPGTGLESVVEEDQTQQQDHDESLAEEVHASEAAQRLGQKRPRRSPRRSPAEPDSTVADEEEEEEAPVPKRRRKQLQASPAKQKQGRPKAAAKPKSSPPKAAPKRRKKKDSDANAGDETVAIPVQRFTKRPNIAEGEDDDADVLNMDIPFIGIGGVNTIDVLTETCDEVFEQALNTIKEGISNTQDKPTRREFQIKLRALQAYQEELKNRLLQHTILVDTFHSLSKRVRSVQKERIALRDEIMRIRVERNQVALRKDAVRIKHDKVKEEALPANRNVPHQNQLTLSSQMHDIELAVERGRAAPELAPAEKRTAELANLEILISRIADQACTRGDTGGALKQIKDFNAFLERAAVALEGR
ncbi:AT hook domain-containing protein-like protein [Colletotrichum musicola]|uniref:AT hook domain-containing protein-like protein n=1 Tax=Colletotrichum musicola TaxID=2175873 RepID=A0A8H6NMW9_9PEZI|nr:AT hook domain-containing protein-like protein [Colletotrichum musicola]